MAAPRTLLAMLALALTAGCGHAAIRASRSPLLAVRGLEQIDRLEVRDEHGERTWGARRPDGVCTDCDWEAVARGWYRGAGTYEIELSGGGRALTTRRFVVRGDEMLVLASGESIHGLIEAEGVHLETVSTERCPAFPSFRLVNDSRPRLSVYEPAVGRLIRIGRDGGHRPDRAACVLVSEYRAPAHAHILPGQSVRASPSLEELVELELAEPGFHFVFYVPIDPPVREGGLLREPVAIITVDVPSCRPTPHE